MTRDCAIVDGRSLMATGAAGATLVAGCLTPPSSGGPRYPSMEIDDGPVFEPGLAEETQRDYDAGLVVTEAQAAAVGTDQLADAEAAFVTETDFEASSLGVIQAGAVNPAARCDVLEVHASDENLTVVGTVRGDTPDSGDRVITTLLLRVARDGGSVPDAIAVEPDTGDHHEAISGSPVSEGRPDRYPLPSPHPAEFSTRPRPISPRRPRRASTRASVRPP